MSTTFRLVERIAAYDLASERGVSQLVSRRADDDGRTAPGPLPHIRDERPRSLEEEFLAALGVDAFNTKDVTKA
ncbi:hypothetical protein [Lentzea jiangxiensis]|uniref:hypothetical protein n=1 Tax=Lentzea jiangxiensis TaxID=641025 RepID=UPI000B7EAF2B|nr:hypothetical protein [Lentzea jiangxiensis]